MVSPLRVNRRPPSRHGPAHTCDFQPRTRNAHRADGLGVPAGRNAERCVAEGAGSPGPRAHPDHVCRRPLLGGGGREVGAIADPVLARGDGVVLRPASRSRHPPEPAISAGRRPVPVGQAGTQRRDRVSRRVESLVVRDRPARRVRTHDRQRHCIRHWPECAVSLGQSDVHWRRHGGCPRSADCPGHRGTVSQQVGTQRRKRAAHARLRVPDPPAAHQHVPRHASRVPSTRHDAACLHRVECKHSSGSWPWARYRGSSTSPCWRERHARRAARSVARSSLLRP